MIFKHWNKNCGQNGSEYYLITDHARQQLKSRFPETVLKLVDFDSIVVPRHSKLIGYDPSTSAKYVDVQGTPMVAIVVFDAVKTFLTKEQAVINLMNKGWLFPDNINAA